MVQRSEAVRICWNIVKRALKSICVLVNADAMQFGFMPGRKMTNARCFVRKRSRNPY